MAASTDASQRRQHLAALVLGLGEERALKWLEENLWLEEEDDYGGPGLDQCVADELNILSDEQVEKCIAELEP